MQANSATRQLALLRRRLRVSQAELAQRIGTTQSAVARLEAGRISPSLRTIETAFEALGHTLDVVAYPLTRGEPGLVLAESQAQYATSGVDLSLIRESLRMSPGDRLAAMAATARSLARLRDAVGGGIPT